MVEFWSNLEDFTILMNKNKRKDNLHKEEIILELIKKSLFLKINITISVSGVEHLYNLQSDPGKFSTHLTPKIHAKCAQIHEKNLGISNYDWKKEI